MQAPARGLGDLHMANRAETTLFIPEKAKDTGAPKRLSHVSFFALFEVGFISRVVGIRVSLDFNVSLDGCATGVAQPNLAWLALVITRFTEEGPILTAVLCEVFLFAPARGLAWVPSSCPSP